MMVANPYINRLRRKVRPEQGITRKVPRVFSFNGVEWKRKCQHVLYIILLRIVS